MHKILATALIVFTLTSCSSEKPIASDTPEKTSPAEVKVDGAKPAPTPAASKIKVAEPSLIPLPTKLKRTTGAFELTQDTLIVAPETLHTRAEILKSYIEPATGLNLKISATGDDNNSIKLVIDKTATDLGEEGYRLSVTPKGVTITAPQEAGIYYGIVTFVQLLPSEVNASKPVNGITWAAPSVEIEDTPRFGWRGMMMDSSRTFQNIEYVKKYIDTLARYKINIFHWHLTDDQGWRFESKAYPKLTELGSRTGGSSKLKHSGNRAWMSQEKEYGGYYTQEQMRDVVAYAKERNINILPEIDLPGHSRAAVVSYPEIECKSDVKSKDLHGQRNNVWCASRSENYVMMNQLLKEVADIFPFEYIHIGGDEVNHSYWRGCPNCNKLAKELNLTNGGQLQPHMTQKLEKMCKDLNRKLVGWNEIMGKGISQDTCIMSWIGVGPGYSAASRGHPVVMAPGPYLYFDMPQGRGERGHFWAGVVTVERSYSFDPLSNQNLTKEQLDNIMGVQSCLWSEFCAEDESILEELKLDEYAALRAGSKNVPAPKGFYDFQTFPRVFATAEIGWTPQKLRNMDEFMLRVARQLSTLDYLDVNYRVPTPVAIIADGIVTIRPPYKGAKVHYTLDGTDPDENSTLYTEPFECADTSKLRMVSYSPNGKRSLSVWDKLTPPQIEFDSSKISSEFTDIEIDVSEHIKPSDSFVVEVCYTYGATALEIYTVSLFENDRKIAEDNHDTVINYKDRKASYAMKLDGYFNDYKEDAKYKVVLRARGINGTDVQGGINVHAVTWKWAIAKPYPYDVKKKIGEQVYAPEQGAFPEEVTPRDALEDGYVDLTKVFSNNKSNVCAYAKTILSAKEAGACRLGFNSDDGVAVWLNGKKIHEADEHRGIGHATEYVDATLNKGKNVLMLKVTQGGGGWGYRVKLDAEFDVISHAPKTDAITGNWAIAKPYPYDIEKKINEQVYPPEQGDFPEEVTIRRAFEDGLVDLRSIFKRNRENVCAYARINIVASEAGAGKFAFNSDDGITVWLNGEKIHELDVYRGVGGDTDYVDANLKKGVNSLMLKVTQGGGGWGFRVRLNTEVEFTTRTPR